MYSTSSTNQSVNKNDRPYLWLAETFSTFLQLLNVIWWNKYSMSTTKFFFVYLSTSIISLPWPTISRYIFNFVEMILKQASTQRTLPNDIEAFSEKCFLVPMSNFLMELGCTILYPLDLVSGKDYEVTHIQMDGQNTRSHRTSLACILKVTVLQYRHIF